jgi:hypothetical protein
MVVRNHELNFGLANLSASRGLEVLELVADDEVRSVHLKPLAGFCTRVSPQSPPWPHPACHWGIALVS